MGIFKEGDDEHAVFDTGLDNELLREFLREIKGSGRTESLRVRLDPPSFRRHTFPLGVLRADKECQALWYYYVLANQHRTMLKEQFILEGELDITPNFDRLFKAAAFAYQVDPNNMGNFWGLVDAEIARYNRERLGDGEAGALQTLPESLRFASVPSIV